jgi:hypothetical protein
MKRTDDVFFFTLIDFLVQVFFFGLLLYVVGQAALKHKQQEAAKTLEDADKHAAIAQASGFSNLTQLLDHLTKLAPVTEWKGVADFFSDAGGFEKVKAAVDVVNKAGGPEQVSTATGLVADAGGPERVKEAVELLRKAGLGKPSCNNANGRPKPAATVVATDSTIRFEGNTPELAEALKLLGLEFAAVQELPLADFRKTFAPLNAKRPDCRYTLRFLESTRFVDARDAARFTFYLHIGRK